MIDVFDGNVLLRLSERYFFRGHPYRAPLLCVCLYYGVPIVLILGPATPEISSGYETWTATAHRYFIDLTHLNFTVIACGIGSYLVYRYWRMVPPAFSQVLANCVVRESKDRCQSILQTAQTLICSIWLKLLMLIGFFGCAATFVYIAVSFRPVHWWGTIDYGYAGLSLAIMIATLFAFGVYGLAVLNTVTMSIQRILSQGITYRPMHADGYYGLKPFVNLISMNFVLSMLGGITIFSTYYLGYFGLERTPFMFGAIAIYIIGTIVIITHPLLVVTRTVGAARSEELGSLEEDIQSRLNILRQDAGSAIKNEDGLLILQEYYALCERKSPFPYPTSVVTIGISTFVAQTILYVKELYTFIHGMQLTQ